MIITVVVFRRCFVIYIYTRIRRERGRIFGARGKDREDLAEAGKKEEGKKWVDILIERVFIYRPYSSAISDWVARPRGWSIAIVSAPARPRSAVHFSSRRPHLRGRSSTIVPRKLSVMASKRCRCTRHVTIFNIREESNFSRCEN